MKLKICLLAVFTALFVVIPASAQQKQEQPQQGQQPKITPQAAQQMLQAIQAKEKETQDKVNKQKAEALKSRQKDKNW